ncbi:MAG: DNA gyrase subunit A, partial [Nitrospiraceae bacterium]
YDTLVRMAQDFNMRYALVDGQGNYGSVDGDPPAAMRYTEARLTKLAEEMLADIDRETVDFGPNYDESRSEPLVLPAKVPNLLINGANGIAVGYATNIPTHNLAEIVDGLMLLIENPDATIEQLMKKIPGPDFPTAGYIYGKKGIKDAYKTGRGLLTLRAKAAIETDERTDKERIIITEIPYQVNKARLIEKIAELIQDRKIEGIADLRDESDREGLRIVIELKREAVPRQVLTLLYKYTAMQTAFSINMLALVEGQPRALTLKMLLLHYLNHRRQVLARRTAYELEQARRRAHILEGLRRALDHLDQVIALIRAARDAETARSSLMKTLGLSEAQAQAILEMQLRRLAALERQKILDELKETQELVARLERLLADPTELLQLIRQELQTLKEKYADARRTRIVAEVTDDLAEEDLVPDQEVALLVTARGYV